jgi:Dodecin
MINHPLESAAAQRSPGRIADHGTQEQEKQEQSGKGGETWQRASTRSSKWSEPAASPGKKRRPPLSSARRKTLRDLRIAEIAELDLQIADGKVQAYRARVKLSFKFEE